MTRPRVPVLGWVSLMQDGERYFSSRHAVKSAIEVLACGHFSTKHIGWNGLLNNASWRLCEKCARKEPPTLDIPALHALPQLTQQMFQAYRSN